MRISAVSFALALLSSTSLVSDASPLLPQRSRGQLERRQVADYVSPEDIKARQLRRRALNYSVVPVNGGGSTADGSPTATTTVVQSVTVTDISSRPSTSSSSASSHQAVTTISATPTPTAVPVITSDSVQVSTKTLDEVVTWLVTAQPTGQPTTTSYYDDGLWHTSYPVKSWATFIPQLNSSTPAIQPHSYTTTVV